MTRCMPCMLCGTHRKLATVYRNAVRLPSSTRRWHAIASWLSLRARLARAALFARAVRQCLEFARAQAGRGGHNFDLAIFSTPKRQTPNLVQSR
jgi:hypothetical protein